MNIVLDSNILLRLSDASDVKHTQAVDAIAELVEAGHELRLVPQVIYEFWVVATRTKSANGLDIPTDEAIQLVDQFALRMPVLFDNHTVYETWRNLTQRYQTRGVPNHDLRIVAAMITHQVQVLLTYNALHFQRVTEIEVLAPDDVSAWLASGQ
jgi:predicted nucleic acid-binding protein